MGNKSYKSLQDALQKLLRKDKPYIFVRHVLGANQAVRSHYHPHANEFVLLFSGECEVLVGKEKKRLAIKKKVRIVEFPKKKPHALTAHTQLKYFVLRDAKDNTIFT